MFTIPFILIQISTIIALITGIIVYRIKRKEQLHYAFLGVILCVIAWNIGEMILHYYIYLYGVHNNTHYYYLPFLGIILTPIPVFFLGKIFAQTKINFKWKYVLLTVVPAISIIMIFTNHYHHLFFANIDYISYITSTETYGPYFYVHAIYSYSLILIGLYSLLYFSIHNSGFFSRQSILLIISIFVPFIINVLTTTKIIILPVDSCYLTAILFTFTNCCIAFAIFRFNFLNIVPVDLQNIVDHISDSYVVIDENYNMVDFNKTFVNNFKNFIHVKRANNLLNEIHKNNIISIDEDDLVKLVSCCRKNNTTITTDITIRHLEIEKVFNIDITPVLNKDKYVGTIILFKDITAIRKAHKQLLEQERFSALGQLIGGIAHDLNSRLYALEGQIYIINKLSDEIKYNETLDRIDYISIADDMLKKIEEIKLSASSMAKTIDSVRNYTRNYSNNNVEVFSMKKIIETVESLLNQKLKRHNCTFIYKQNKEDDICIKGDFSKFEGVLINIINNAIESYEVNAEKNGGPIEINAIDSDNETIVSVTDYGKGIPENIRSSIFKEILTTKGANGTGMGLYFSHIIVIDNFNGEITFDSEEEKGTTFYIKIPKKI